MPELIPSTPPMATVLPPYAKGDTGPQGPVGPMGPMGPTGVLVGDEAVAWNERIKNIIGADTRAVGDRRVLSCILRPRLDGTGTWSFIDDSGHDLMGPTSVAVVGGLLQITYPAAVAVLGCSVSCDETFTRQGYSAGASVGTSVANITLAHVGVSGLVQSSGGVWTIASASKCRLTSITYSSGTGNITINHDPAGLLALPLVQPLPYVAGETYVVNTGFGQGSTTVKRVVTTTGAAITGAPPDGLGFIFQRIAARPELVLANTLTLPNGNIWVTLILQY